MEGSCGVKHSGAKPAKIAVSEHSPLSNNLKAKTHSKEALEQYRSILWI